MELPSHRVKLRVSEGYVASSCHGGKCEWLYRSVCRVRQELNPMLDHETIPVEAAVPAAILSTAQATRLREASLWQARLSPHRRIAGFTLAELVVTVGVLVLLVLAFTQLLNTAANVTTLGHKQMDADSQARQ